MRKKLLFLTILSFLMGVSSGDVTYKNYITIEGEDAYSTNFASTATAYFFASNRYTLQLSKGAKSTYFAKYIFFNPIDREYELWFGATPPGGRNNPYMSPVYIKIDNGPLIKVENVEVSDNYAIGGFYFYRVITGRLSRGEHTLQIIVRDPREYDGKYVFYIDKIILIPKYGKEYIKSIRNKGIFPKNLSPKKRFSFKPINAYKNLRDVNSLKDYATILSWIGRYDDAISVYNQLLGLTYGDIMPRLGIVLNLLWGGKQKEAFKKLDELIKSPYIKEKDKLVLMKFYGKLLAWNGNYSKAIRLFREVVGRNKYDIEAYIELGNAYMWSGEVAKAEALFAKALNIMPDNKKLYYEIAKNYELNREYSKAIEWYKKIIDKFPYDYTAYQKLANLYIKIGKEKKASEIIQLGKKRGIAQRVKKGNLVRKHIIKPEIIISQAKSAVSLDFLNLQKHLNLLSIYEWYKKEDNAIKEYNTILSLKLYLHISKKLEENDRGLLNISKVIYLSNLDECESGGNPISQEELQNISIGLKNFESSLDDFVITKNTIKWELDLSNIKSRMNNSDWIDKSIYYGLRGFLNYFENSYSSSRNDVITSMRIKRNKVYNVIPFLGLEGRFPNLVKTYKSRIPINEKIRPLFDEDIRFFNKYKCILKKDKENIKKLASKAIQIKRLFFEELIYEYYTENSNFLNRLGVYYIYLKDPNNAQSVFEEILAIYPDSIEANMRLGELYQWGRRYYSAKIQYEKVIDIDSKNRLAKAKRKEIIKYASPWITIESKYHQEPIVSRLSIKLNGDYIYNDFLTIEAFTRYKITKDTLGMVVSTLYSNATNNFSAIDVGVTLHLFYPWYSLYFDIGYYARSYNGKIDLEYFPEYSEELKRLSHNFFGSISYIPISFPFMFKIIYRYEDLDELTQAIRLRLFYHRIEALLNIKFSFIDIPVIRDTFFYQSVDYQIISDSNTRLKTYSKLGLELLKDNRLGYIISLGGLFILETSKFNEYSQDNIVFRMQGNVPYYAPVGLKTFGGFIEINENLEPLIDKKLSILLGGNYLVNSRGDKIMNPYLGLFLEIGRIQVKLHAAYTESATFQTYESNAKFKSYDMFFSINSKLYNPKYVPKTMRLGESFVIIKTDKNKYNFQKDTKVAIKVRAYDSTGIASYRLIVKNRDGKTIDEIKKAQSPPTVIYWEFKAKNIPKGLYQIYLVFKNKKGEEIYSDPVFVKIE